RAFLDDEAGNPTRPVLPGARHHQINVCCAASGNESLRAVDHVSVPLAYRPRPQARRVGTGPRLGQAVTRERLHRAKAWEQPLALGFATEIVDHPSDHVVDRQIGGSRGAALCQFFQYDRRVEPAKAGTSEIAADVNAAEAERRGFAQRGDGKHLLLVPLARKRYHFGAGELACGRLEGSLLLGKLEVHVSSGGLDLGLTPTPVRTKLMQVIM